MKWNFCKPKFFCKAANDHKTQECAFYEKDVNFDFETCRYRKLFNDRGYFLCSNNEAYSNEVWVGVEK